MNCKNCHKYFNCDFAALGALEKIVFAHIRFFEVPFKAITLEKSGKKAIICDKYAPDQRESASDNNLTFLK